VILREWSDKKNRGISQGYFPCEILTTVSLKEPDYVTWPSKECPSKMRLLESESIIKSMVRYQKCRTLTNSIK